MDYFHYQDQELYVEEVPVTEIIKKYGSPIYIYSKRTLLRHWHAFNDAFAKQAHMICYAVKANSNLAILKLLAENGSGFDIVSLGELTRVLQAGGNANKIIFSGSAKQINELQAGLDANIYCFNIESENELILLEALAKQNNKIAPIALRVNPDIDAKTHPYISTGLKENKFGIEIPHAISLYEYAKNSPFLKVVGIGAHIGSQIMTIEPFIAALSRIVNLIEKLSEQDISFQHLDLGGGLGVRYREENPPLPNDLTLAIVEYLQKQHAQLLGSLKLILEPGRAIAANAGIFVSQVLFKKQTTHRQFLFVDGAMNDLLRPALYSADHEIVVVKTEASSNEVGTYDIVGPICESADCFAKNRQLAVNEHDYLAIRGAGAYGFVMSSQYNSRPRVAEVLVDGKQFALIRERETIDDLFAKELIGL